MKKQLSAVLAVSVLALGLTACTDRFEKPGTYESESSRTDANGTRIETSNEKNVSIDASGKKHVTKSTTTTKDPKGLLNKSTSESKTSKTYENY